MFGDKYIYIFLDKYMKKRLIYLIPFLAILIVGIIFAYTSQVPNPGHGADKILISVDGYTMTLQEAIDNDFLVDNGPSPTKSYTSQVLTGHSENIFVSVSGNEKTIGQAISSSLCGSGSDTYNSAITLGHNANEIWVSIDGSEMTLQSAINRGEFCCSCSPSACVGSTCTDLGKHQICPGTKPAVNGGWTGYTCGGWGACSASCGGGTQTQTCTRTCNNPAPSCGGTSCSGSTSYINTQNCNTQSCDWSVECSCFAPKQGVTLHAYHKFEGGNHYTKVNSIYDSGWVLGNHAKKHTPEGDMTYADFYGTDIGGTIKGSLPRACYLMGCNGDQQCEVCYAGCTCTASR